MKAINEMSNIQIDITNQCVNSCSNCTRFCGHYKNNFFMDFDYFKEAVDSLCDFPGVLGLIGGEPTIHPEFEKFSKYLLNHRVGKRVLHSRKPIKDMNRHIYKNLVTPYKGGCGLWSSLSKGYYKHFEIINDTFAYQLLNDHKNTCMHQGLLVSRSELGIPDNEWFQLRDKCWIQNSWSATITPKGAFFCEVAGALDMLFNGDGGWDISDKNWWRRDPSQFKGQLHWCEKCGAALNTPKRLSNDGRDDVSPEIKNALHALDSPKIKAGKFVIFDIEAMKNGNFDGFSHGNEYMENSIRATHGNKDILPRTVDSCDDASSLHGWVLKNNPRDWVLVSTGVSDAILNDITRNIKKTIINPGCLYKGNEFILFNVIASSIKDTLSNNKIKYDLALLSSLYPADKVVTVPLNDWYSDKSNTWVDSLKGKIRSVVKGSFRAC